MLDGPYRDKTQKASHYVSSLSTQIAPSSFNVSYLQIMKYLNG